MWTRARCRLVAVAISAVAGTTCSSAAFAARSTAVPTRALIASLRSEIGQLRGQDAKAGEGNDAEYFFNTVTIIIGVAAGLITIVAVAATVASYKVVRAYVSSEFRKQAAAVYEMHGKPMVEAALDTANARLDEMLVSAEERLANHLELFGKADEP